MHPGAAVSLSNSFIQVVLLEASALVPGRMMARLVHIPYQLFQPNEFDSINVSARAFETPQGALPGTGRHQLARPPQYDPAYSPCARLHCARAPRPSRSSMAHRSGTQDMSAEFPRRRSSARESAISGKAARVGALWAALPSLARGDEKPKRDAPLRHPSRGRQFRDGLPSRLGRGSFSLGARAMPPHRVARVRASLSPIRGWAHASPVRAPACLPSCFIALQNTTGQRRRRAARLVLVAPSASGRRVSPRCATPFRAIAKPC
jgi:hypothetical protein